VKLARNLALFLVCATLVFSAYGQKKPKGKKAKANATDSVAPDKVLYEGAMDKIQHGRYEVARLQLQALLNTYPDSEYLAKAKLGVADAYFKEGGTGNLTLAIDEYKSFITFFPFLDEAAYAQMQIAMTHYRRLDKPDRDRTEAELAEQEFQTFLQKYPNSPLTAVSEQRLRDVQEMLAEGDYRIANYYDTKKAYKSSMARFTDITNRYPLYSKSDLVLLKLGDLWLKAPLNVPADQKEQMELARKQLASTYYSRIVRDYPLSSLVPKAKEKLTSLGVAVPQPDPVALARMQQDQQIPRNRPGIFSHVSGMIHSAPDVSMSARVGSPNMNPPDDNSSASDALVPAAGGMNVVGGNATGGGTGSGASGTAGTTGSTTSDASSSTTGSTAAVQILSTGETAKPGTAAPAPSSTTPSTTPPATSPAGSTPPPPPPTTGATGESSSSTAAGSQSSAATTGAAQTPAKAAPNPPCTSKDKRAECKTDSGKESSSKKKGIKKIIPW
jgi:outer membrane protein assembly factor BamD